MDKDAFYQYARTDLAGPLAGVRVLDVTTTWAGPMCSSVLADLGADVLKIEIPSGDVGRALTPMLPGTQTSFAHATVNRNKRAIALDIRKPEGRDVLLELARTADVFVENFKVGTMQRYGLGYEQVCAVKPDMVYVSITGWGQFGPNQDAAGYDPLAQAASGFMSLNGAPDGSPTKTGTFLADDLGGLHGALGALAALRHRDQTGEGQHVDVALLDAMLFQSSGMPSLGAMGVDIPRMGNQFGFAVPANVYECKDGPVFVGVLLDTHWQILAPVIGAPELAEDPEFATREGRAVKRDRCNTLLGDWLMQRTRDEALAELRAKGLPVAPVNKYTEIADDPHVQARDMLQMTQLPDGNEVPITGPAAKFSKTPTRVRSAAPEIGQHTDDILSEAGLSPAQIAQLRQSNIVK